MALSTPTFLSSNSSDAAGSNSTVTSASVSPPSDCLLVIGIGGVFTASNTISSITTTLSNVGSWTIAHERGYANPSGVHEIAAIAYAKVTGAPGSGTITANFTNATGYTCVISVAYIASGFHATPTGAVGYAENNAGSTITATLGSTPATASTVLGFMYAVATVNTDNNLTPDAAYTELEDGYHWYPIGLASEWQLVYDAGSADNTVDFPRSTNYGAVAVAVEFVEAADTYIAPRITRTRYAVHRASLR